MNAEKKIEKKYVETPLMKQYYSIKAVHPDAILLFRVGDFYETFGEDAIKASGILGITLTRRANGSATYVELAGFPYHAIDTYVPLDKQLRMMELMLKLYHGAKDIVSRAIPLSQLKETGIFESLAKMKYEVPNDGQEKFAEYDAAIEDALRQVNEANR